MEFSRPEYQSGWPFPSPGDLLNSGTEPPGIPHLQADSLPTEPQGKPKRTGMGSLFLLQRIFQTQKGGGFSTHGKGFKWPGSQKMTNANHFLENLSLFPSLVSENQLSDFLLFVYLYWSG